MAGGVSVSGYVVVRIAENKISAMCLKSNVDGSEVCLFQRVFAWHRAGSAWRLYIWKGFEDSEPICHSMPRVELQSFLDHYTDGQFILA